jgi:hypothetical protein
MLTIAFFMRHPINPPRDYVLGRAFPTLKGLS